MFRTKIFNSDEQINFLPLKLFKIVVVAFVNFSANSTLSHILSYLVPFIHLQNSALSIPAYAWHIFAGRLAAADVNISTQVVHMYFLKPVSIYAICMMLNIQ